MGYISGGSMISILGVYVDPCLVMTSYALRHFISIWRKKSYLLGGNRSADGSG
ncbi:hypothetical protein BDV38DRAFT_249423 [Aspergillus pseudotamarii]|uniref:Uncharacterized protein n=1 Tax=Aspergillus pseudotamarii TaxID=132259 RepID=A0A5N6SPM6_ASPPS|nr:uncharacterized protein BDV38DRAFT_249423 [Aspergillus pseudotamarii]KAE8136648.1 hypothetical protein BDV38DRAFT_249423 [Aspergillus pseudotamarii]